MGITISIYTRVYPTESVEKIKKAILSIFPDSQFSFSSDTLKGISHDISTFAKLLKEQRIRDTARSVLLGNLRGDRVEFRINKQVATVGKVSFSVGDVPLGDIRVVVEGENLAQVIDEIAPDTRQL